MKALVEFFEALYRRRHCAHSNLAGIYGDAIIASGFYRLRCLDCYALLRGPVILAQMRTGEPR